MPKNTTVIAELQIAIITKRSKKSVGNITCIVCKTTLFRSGWLLELKPYSHTNVYTQKGT